MIRSRDPTLSSANQFTCSGSSLQVYAQGQSHFKVRTLPSATLDSSNVSLAKPFSLPAAQSCRLTASPSRCLHMLTHPTNEGDTFQTDRSESVDYHATWVNRNERLRRTGAAPALRLYRGLKSLHLSRQTRMVHGGVVRGERTRRVTIATIAGVAALHAGSILRRADPSSRACRASGESRKPARV